MLLIIAPILEKSIVFTQLSHFTGICNCLNCGFVMTRGGARICPMRGQDPRRGPATISPEEGDGMSNSHKGWEKAMGRAGQDRGF